MNETKRQMSVEVLTELPLNYYRERLEAWDRNALFWTLYINEDQQRTALLNKLSIQISKLVADIASPRIIDFGCGEGFLLRLCCQLIPEAALVGVDFSRSMLALAKRRSDMMQQVSFQLGNIEDQVTMLTPSYDLVMCVLTLDEVQDIDAAFNNISAAMHPSATALIVVLDPITELLRHGLNIGNNVRVEDLNSRNTLLLLKHFRVGQQISPAPYNRIIRSPFDYIEAAAHQGLRHSRTERWSFGSSSTVSLIGPMVNIMFFHKSSESDA
jgi:SAM-dependent methyltransferase